MGDVGCQLEASLVFAAPCVSKLSQLLWPGLYRCLGTLVRRFELCSIQLDVSCFLLLCG